MKKRITPPAKGKTIKASFLNDIAAAASKVGGPRESKSQNFKTVRVVEDFAVAEGETFSRGEVVELLFDVDEAGSVFVAGDAADKLSVVDPTGSLHERGAILNVYFNSQAGEYQTFNSNPLIPQEQVAKFAQQCGCNDWLPEEHLIVEYGDFGPYSQVYYVFARIPTPTDLIGNNILTYGRYRLEHVADNLWASAEFDFYSLGENQVRGTLEMRVVDVVVVEQEYLSVHEPMAFVTFKVSEDSEIYLYEAGGFPTEVTFRTHKPFQGALNGNALVFSNSFGPNPKSMYFGCDGCLAASRDLLPCEECLLFTRAFVTVSNMPDSAPCPEPPELPLPAVPPSEYTLYSEVNSFFDGVPGWPLSGQLCAFESDRTFEINDITYKLVLFRMDAELYESYVNEKHWKIGIVGYDISDPTELIVGPLFTLENKSCSLYNEEVELRVYDTQGGCFQPTVVKYLDAGAV